MEFKLFYQIYDYKIVNLYFVLDVARFKELKYYVYVYNILAVFRDFVCVISVIVIARYDCACYNRINFHNSGSHHLDFMKIGHLKSNISQIDFTNTF